MFDNAFIIPESRIRTASWAFPLSLAAHAAFVLVLVIIPLLRPIGPPPIRIDGAFLAPARVLPLPPPPPPGRSSSVKRSGRIAPVQTRPAFDAGKMVSPVEIPTGVADELIPGFGIDGGVPDGIPGGVDNGIISGPVLNILAPLVGDTPEPVAAVGDIRPPRLLKKVDPLYPDLARESRTEGIVIIEAQTDTYGRVSGARILRSVPLLDEAALEAVRQWVYEPMIVNGRPRGVVFTVSVRFVLK